MFTVSNTSDGTVTGAGQLPGSLRQAIFDANALSGADVIDFDTTTFNTPATITLTTGELSITGAVTIDATLAEGVTVNGAGSSRVFNINVGSGSVTIDTVNITGGKVTEENGGGILVQDGTLSLKNCNLISNTVVGSSSVTAEGGAIYAAKGTLNLDSCVIDKNSATVSGKGGGISIGNASVTLTKCNVTSNLVIGSSSVIAEGGGIYASKGTLSLDFCLLDKNSATVSGNGGGISTGDANVTLTNCIVTGNTVNRSGSYSVFSSRGGGLNASTGSLTLTDCIVSGNGVIDSTDIKSTLQGGGIFSNDVVSLTRCELNNNKSRYGGGINVFTESNLGNVAKLTIDQCTIHGNSAVLDGGGIRLGLDMAGEVMNSTISSNKAGFGGGVEVFSTDA